MPAAAAAARPRSTASPDRSMPTNVAGGGVGTDQQAAVRRLLDAVGVPVAFEVYAAGRAALEQGQDALPADALAAVRRVGVALKTKLLPPRGAGTPTPHGPAVPANVNV